MFDSTEGRVGALFTNASAIIRTLFYAIGCFSLAMLGLTLLSFPKKPPPPKVVELPPAFRLAAPELASLSTRALVIEGGAMSRAEARHYGQLYDRDRDMTVIMVTPPKGTPITRDFVQEMGSISFLRQARASLTSIYYDLETRFGSVRAAEMRVDVDGRRKLCLAFLSRFDTPAVYLKGWICEASGMKPSPDALACMLNRFVLDGPLVSPEAESFLRDRIARGPSTCWSTPVSQTTDTRPPRPPVRRY